MFVCVVNMLHTWCETILQWKSVFNFICVCLIQKRNHNDEEGLTLSFFLLHHRCHCRTCSLYPEP